MVMYIDKLVGGHILWVERWLGRLIGWKGMFGGQVFSLLGLWQITI